MSDCTIFNASDIATFRVAGKILRDALKEVSARVIPGITTEELDAIAETYIRDHGGTPAFKGYQGFPATLCTSVNEECVHGIPSDRVLKEGDIVSLDCGVLLDGLYTDACITVGVGKISTEAQHLLHVTENALGAALDILKAGTHVGDISSIIQKTAEAGGCHPVQSLTGHGLGRHLHLFPDIPNRGKAGTGVTIPAGTVLAIEPILSLGSDEVRATHDGWTLVTEDLSLTAHSEHSVLVTEEGCEILS